VYLFDVDIWILADTDIGVFTDIGSYNDPISCHMSRYRVFHVTRYRDMSDETRYRVTLTRILTPISGATRYRVMMSPILYTAYPISGSISGPISGIPISGPATPDIGVNIGDNIRCHPISDRCQYRRQYRVSRYRGLTASDIVVNIGHDIGLQTVLPRG
jgi:hypothetical protein